MADKDFKIRFVGENSSFGRAANEATRQINSVRDAIRNLPRDAIRSAGSQLAAFFSVGFAAQQIRNVVEYAGAISDMSTRLGVTTDFLQEADYAARQTGSSLSEVGLAIRELMRSQAAAIANPGGTDATAFGAIGISIDEVRRLSPEQLFRRVAQAIQDGAASGRQMEAAMQILGRAGSSVLPAMRQGFADLAEQARNAGIVIETELIERLDAAGDAAALASARMRSGWALLTGWLAKAYNWQTERIDAGMQGLMAAWDAKSGGLVAMVKAFRDARASTLEGFDQEEDAHRKAMEDRRKKGLGAMPEAGLSKTKAASGADARDTVNADALQRIGLFISGQAQADLMRRQLSAAERSLSFHRQMAETLKRGLL